VTGGDSGEVVLDGLLIAGGRLLVPAQVNGQPNRLQRLRLLDCTFVPGGGLTRAGRPGSLATSVEVEAPNVTLEIDRSIVGALRVDARSSAVLSDSIVDGLAPERIAYAAPGGADPGGALSVDACTIVGKAHAAQLTASDSIFHAELAPADVGGAPIVVERRQAGYVRYSYIPPGAHLPPRYASRPAASDAPVRMVPRFTSLRYGEPGYCQLGIGCPAELRHGAADGGEMGAFHHLYAPQREAGLLVRLEEFMRFGLEAGLFFPS
jgi:hypothetical protein